MALPWIAMAATTWTGTLHDLPGVYRVCLLTGRAGEDASALHDDPDLLGHVWAGAYLVYPGAVSRVVRDDHGVAGYCVGVPDTAAFEEWVDAQWLPPLRARHPRGSGTTPGDRALVERLHEPARTDAGLLAEHPAHLHIDLLPRLQGQGWGRRLLTEVLDGLAQAGAAGVHLGVDEENSGARAFYARLGFTELSAPPGARVYGIRMARRG
jgi:ribosomal protein S18 acetylase RimI-like enzyme